MDALYERSCRLCAELLSGQRSRPSARRCSAQNLPRGLHKGKGFELGFEPAMIANVRNERLKGHHHLVLKIFMGGNRYLCKANSFDFGVN